MEEEERVLNQAKQFLSKTIKQYQDIEKSMQNKVNEINGDTKPKKNIFSKIFDAVTSPLRKNIEIIQKIISLPVIIGRTIIGNTVIKGVGDILSEEGSKVTNEPIEEEKKKTDDSSIPPLSGVLSYNPNVYSEEVLMMQKRLNEIYAGVSGYKKIKEDGYFGPETLAAVNRYKEEHGLWNFGEYEGKVGETTWRHLFTPRPGEKVQHNENPTVSKEKNEPVVVDDPGLGGSTGGASTDAARQKIVDEAAYWIGKGVAYQFGSPHYNNESPVKRILSHSNPPASLDCSDFVAGVYATALGISFDDYTGSQLKVGTSVDITKAKAGDFSDLKPGDLIIFDWPSNGTTPDGDHVAIYVGGAKAPDGSIYPEGTFIHQGSSGTKQASLNDKWEITNNNYVRTAICGINRVIQDNNTYINNPSAGQKAIPSTDKPPMYYYEACSIGLVNSINTTKFNLDLNNIKNIYDNNKATYEEISQLTGIPPELICALHYRESGCDFNTYLHNGQPLGTPTTIVPVGRLFSDFKEAAVDALLSFKWIRDQFGITSDCNDLASLMAFAETYNGTGYRDYHNMVSPYVFSGTNVYQKGKYVSDGKFDPNAVDGQPGVYILVCKLMNLI